MITLVTKLLYIILAIFIFIISLDPGGVILNLKMPLFILLTFLSSFLYLKKKISIPKSILQIFLLLHIIPLYSICLASISGNLVDMEYAMGHCKSLLFVYLFFTLIVLDFEKIYKIFFVNGCILASITLIIYLYIYFDPITFRVIYDFTKENEIAMLSMRNYYGITVMGTYMKTGPLMFFSYIYALYFMKKNKLRKALILINMFAILVAGSRVPVLIGILITSIYIYENKINNKYIKYLSFTFFGTAFLAFILILASEKTEVSNMVKFGNFASYMTEIFKGSTPIFGAGLGSVFWGEGFGRFISYSELTYLDLLRIYGLILGSILIFIFNYPIYILLKNWNSISYKYKHFCLAYLMYMILSGTNPVLLSSTGMFVYSLGLTFVYHYYNKKDFILYG